jgi:hypothetical protein
VDVIGTHHSIMAHEPHVMHLVQKIDQHLHQLHDCTSEQTLHERDLPGRAVLIAGS